MNLVDVIRGRSPIILAMPHSGLFVPDEIYERFNRYGRELADTDWHVDRLYAGLLPDVTMIRANFHRYVIDHEAMSYLQKRWDHDTGGAETSILENGIAKLSFQDQLIEVMSPLPQFAHQLGGHNNLNTSPWSNSRLNSLC